MSDISGKQRKIVDNISAILYRRAKRLRECYAHEEQQELVTTLVLLKECMSDINRFCDENGVVTNGN